MVATTATPTRTEPSTTVATTSEVGSLPATTADASARSTRWDGRQIADAIIGAAHWYGEHWEDLVIEARAERAAGRPEPELAEVLAGLADAHVESEIPGRVRLRLGSMRGHEHLADRLADTLWNVPGITRAEVSALTGSILIFYSTTSLADRAAVISAAADQPR